MLTSESGLVDHEFGLAKTTAGNGATGVGNLLNLGHARNPGVDTVKESGVTARHIAIDDILVNERAVSNPGIAVGISVKAKGI